MSSVKTMLLVTPAFQGYGGSIARGFERIGYRVVNHLYDDLPTLSAKIRNKVVFEGLDKVAPGEGSRRFANAITQAARERVIAERPDLVLVIKGDRLGAPFWEEVDRRGVPSFIWLYDELRRTGYSLDDLRRFPFVITYSPLDVVSMRDAGLEAHVIADAFDPIQVGVIVPSSDVVFVGARYANREALLVELQSRGVPVRAYGRDWSFRVRDRLRTWSWYRPDVPGRPSVSRAVAAGVMAGSLAALNIHGDQDGFTMRTFEAAGAGALQMIDREDIDVHYEPEKEILTFSSVDGLCDQIARARHDPVWARGIARAARRRTLAEHTFAHRAAEIEKLWA